MLNPAPSPIVIDGETPAKLLVTGRLASWQEKRVAAYVEANIHSSLRKQ
jgi:hypothetical protein